MRGAVRIRGGLGESPGAAPAPELSVEELARELARDAELHTAYRNLKLALADPQMRPTVLAALDAFARVAQPEH